MVNAEISIYESFENEAADVTSHVEQEYQDETEDEITTDNAVAQTLNELLAQTN